MGTRPGSSRGSVPEDTSPSAFSQENRQDRSCCERVPSAQDARLGTLHRSSRRRPFQWVRCTRCARLLTMRGGQEHEEADAAPGADLLELGLELTTSIDPDGFHRKRHKLRQLPQRLALPAVGPALGFRPVQCRRARPGRRTASPPRLATVAPPPSRHAPFLLARWIGCRKPGTRKE